MTTTIELNDDAASATFGFDLDALTDIYTKSRRTHNNMKPPAGNGYNLTNSVD